jgi:hypothetical protein
MLPTTANGARVTIIIRVLGRMWLKMMRRVLALGPRRHHVVPRPLLVGEGAHVPGDPHPAEQHVDADEQAEVRLGQETRIMMT